MELTTNSSTTHFVWHDCLTGDIDRTIDYFANLTEWQPLEQTSPNIGRYPIFINQKKAIGGILEMPVFMQKNGVPPYWTGYVTTDLTLAEVAIPRLGGRLFTMPAKSAAGTSFIFTDPGGAVLAAYEPSENFKLAPSSRSSDIICSCLFSHNPDRSVEFYSALFGWKPGERNGDNNHALLDNNGRDIGAISGGVSWLESDTWVYFIGVADITQTKSLINQLGGSMIEQLQISGKTAIVTKDVLGGVIGFVEN